MNAAVHGLAPHSINAYKNVVKKKKSSTIGDTINFLHLLLGDWTAILSGHLSYAKVKPFAGQGLHLHSLVNTLSIVQIKKNVK